MGLLVSNDWTHLRYFSTLRHYFTFCRTVKLVEQNWLWSVKLSLNLDGWTFGWMIEATKCFLHHRELFWQIYHLCVWVCVCLPSKNCHENFQNVQYYFHLTWLIIYGTQIKFSWQYVCVFTQHWASFMNVSSWPSVCVIYFLSLSVVLNRREILIILNYI